MIKTNLAVVLVALSTVCAQQAFSDNLHKNQKNHEDMAALDMLIRLGCMGKLKVATNAIASYDPESLRRLQECAQHESETFKEDAIALHSRESYDNSPAPAFLFTRAVLFAKQYNHDIEHIPNAELVEAARERGTQLHPYLNRAAR